MYPELFKNHPLIGQRGGLSKPYVYNDQFIEEGDPFFRDQVDEKMQKEEHKEKQGIEAEQLITQEAAKIQLGTMYQEIVKDYDILKTKVIKIIDQLGQTN